MSADNIGKDQLRALAERIIRLEDEKDALVADIREVKSEAKASGYNGRALNAAIKRVRMTAQERERSDQLEMEIDLYVSAIESISDD